MVSYVRVMTAPNKYESLEVPYAIAVYIKQLEAVVRNPELTGLKKLYYPRLEPRQPFTGLNFEEEPFKMEYPENNVL